MIGNPYILGRLDADLISIATLGTAADKMLYTTAVDTWAETSLTPFARSILDDADEATFKATANLEIGTDVQAWDAGLDSLAALTYVSDSFIKVTAEDTYAIRTIAETKTDLSLNLVENTALSTWVGSGNITTLGTITTGVWEATDVGIAGGGTGQSTAQLAINALSAVSGATNEQVLTKDTATGNAIWKASTGYLGYIKVTDTKAQNTNGGTFTALAWRTRDLTTEDTDTNSDCSLASNQITLTAGTYECRISCCAYEVDTHQARLYNTTGATTVLIGTCEFSASGGQGGHTSSIIAGRFTIAASQALEVQQYCVITRATYGFGIALNQTSEVYAIAEFWRVS